MDNTNYLQRLFTLCFISFAYGECGLYVGGKLAIVHTYVCGKQCAVIKRHFSEPIRLPQFKGMQIFLKQLRSDLLQKVLYWQHGRWDGVQLNYGVDFQRVYPAAVGFGITGNQLSLQQVQTKLDKIFNDFKSYVKTKTDGHYGFYVEGTPSVTIAGNAGSARWIRNSVVWLKNRCYPSYQVPIIMGHPNGITLSDSAFADPYLMYREIADVFFQRAPGDILDAWLQVPEEEKARIGQEIMTTEDQQCVERYGTQKSSMLGAVNLLVGYHRSYFQSDTAKFGTYYGAEVFYEATLGSQKLTHSSISTTRTKTGKGNVSITSSTYPSEYEALKVRQPQAWGATAFLGVTLRKGWSFYLPVSWRIASYNIDVQRSAGGKGIEITALTQPISIMEEVDKKLPMTDHLRTWKNEFEGGVGVRLSVTSRVTLGMRWTSSFTPTKLAFHSQSYEIVDTANSAKSREIGSRCNVKVRRQKFCLELLWNFRHGR